MEKEAGMAIEVKDGIRKTLYGHQIFFHFTEFFKSTISGSTSSLSPGAK